MDTFAGSSFAGVCGDDPTLSDGPLDHPATDRSTTDYGQYRATKTSKLSTLPYPPRPCLGLVCIATSQPIWLIALGIGCVTYVVFAVLNRPTNADHDLCRRAVAIVGAFSAAALASARHLNIRRDRRDDQ